MGCHVPAVASGWAAFPVITRIGRRFVLRWRQIFEQCLRFGGGAAPVADGQHPHNAHLPRLRKGQHHTGADRAGWFADMRPIHAHLASGDNFAGKAAGFEKPRVPQPFVNPLAGVVAHPFFRPASAAAKGLSGSIRSFFLSGRAE